MIINNFRRKIEEKENYEATPLENGAIYQGEWKDCNIKEGFGIIHWIDGSSYAGHWEKDKSNGYGVLRHNNGDVYEGYFKEDRCEGYGVYTKNNGDK